MLCFLNSFLIAVFTFIYLILFSFIIQWFGFESELWVFLSRVSVLAISIGLAVWTKNKVMPKVARGQVCGKGVQN